MRDTHALRPPHAMILLRQRIKHSKSDIHPLRTQKGPPWAPSPPRLQAVTITHPDGHPIACPDIPNSISVSSHRPLPYPCAARRCSPPPGFLQNELSAASATLQHTLPLKRQSTSSVSSMTSSGFLPSVPLITSVHTWSILLTTPQQTSPNAGPPAATDCSCQVPHPLPLSPTPS
jgi:hypothetical protein